jgi:hypothetical protein
MLLVYRKKAMLIQIEESCPITKKKWHSQVAEWRLLNE